MTTITGHTVITNPSTLKINDRIAHAMSDRAVHTGTVVGSDEDGMVLVKWDGMPDVDGCLNLDPLFAPHSVVLIHVASGDVNDVLDQLPDPFSQEDRMDSIRSTIEIAMGRPEQHAKY